MLRPLDRFRKDLGERVEPLNVIWKHRVDHGEWITRRDTHDACERRGIRDGRSTLAHLGGSIVFEAREGERECYRLTLLGVLLTAEGPAIEGLVGRHLQALPITPAETAVLRRVLEVADGGIEDVASKALASYDPTLPIERTNFRSVK
jgi:hypothetical protein